jgi:hypothetical protein
MDISGKARRIERKLARSVEAAIGELVGRESPAPLEIVHAVLERAEREVQEIGRGRRIFPFTRIRVLVPAGPRDRETRARLEAVLDGPPSLGERLNERLRAAGCHDPRVSAEVAYVKQAAPDWEHAAFHVVFERTAGPAPSAPAAAPSPAAAGPRLKLTVTKGTAAQRAYVFNGGRVDVGRREEVLDQQQRLIRTNHVAFAENDSDENRSVSRRHAHIAFVAAEGGYRIWDDRSAHGTRLVRDGRTVAVPASARGIRLASGDEIVLGQARLKVTIG